MINRKRRIFDFGIKEFAVHCKTKNEAVKLLEMLDELGYTWYSGEKCTSINNWDKYEKNTYYIVYVYKKYVTYTNTYGVGDHKIIEYSEYMNKLKAESRTESEYEKSIKEMISHCESILIEKHGEYATSDDFHNFNVAAELQGITPLQALIGMMDKHVVSVHDYVNEHAEGRKIKPEQWKEKIGDNINYLLILWAMVNQEGKQ